MTVELFLGAQTLPDAESGNAIVEAMRLLKALELTPRQMIRAVLFTNEENGMRGGTAYSEAHGGELGLGLEPDTSHYFDVHHSPADTVDRIDPRLLQRNAAAMALMAFVLAERAISESSDRAEDDDAPREKE